MEENTIMEEMPPRLDVSMGIKKWYVIVNINIKEVEGGYTCESVTATLDNYPTRSDVVKMVNDYINAKTDEKILSGFVWRDNPVWLSSENQFNFKCAYDLAYQTEGASLPAKYKLGEDADGNPIYFNFTDLQTFQDFYLGCVGWIQRCINEGWVEKDSVDYDEIIPKSREDED